MSSQLALKLEAHRTSDKVTRIVRKAAVAAKRIQRWVATGHHTEDHNLENSVCPLWIHLFLYWVARSTSSPFHSALRGQVVESQAYRSDAQAGASTAHVSVSLCPQLATAESGGAPEAGRYGASGKSTIG